MTGILFLLAMSATVAQLQAYSWAGQGFRDVQAEEKADQWYVSMKDSQGRAIKVRASRKLDARQGQRVKEVHKTLTGWKHLQIKEMRFVLSSGVIEVLVVPEELTTTSGKDILQYLPSGLSFSYIDSLQYNFRLKIQNLFVRIKGQYIKESEVLEKIQEAIKNPHGYIRKRDPEYFLRQLERLDKELDIARKNNAQLREEMEIMRTGFMALVNEGFFSGPEMISQDKVDAVVRLKTEKPSIKAEEIQKKLEAQKMEVSSKEIRIILAAYFGVLPED